MSSHIAPAAGGAKVGPGDTAAAALVLLLVAVWAEVTRTGSTHVVVPGTKIAHYVSLQDVT